MPYDKIDQLYDALKKDGAVNKSRENFRSKMLAPGKEGYQNRLQLYNALKADGAVNSPTYEEFRNRLGLHAVNAASPNKSGGTNGAGGHPMSAAQKQLMLGSVRGLVANAKAGVAGTRNRIANQMAMVKKPFNTSPRIGENKNVREKGYRYNDNSGKLEKTYVTTLGNEYDSRYNADQEQKQIDQLNHDSSLGGQLENAYAERDRLDEALKKRRQEVDQGEGKLARFLRGLAANSSSGNGALAYNAQEMRYNDNPEYLQLMAAARKNHTTIQLLEDKKNNKMNEFWHNVGTTMLNGYTFSDGLSEMQDAIALQDAEKHLDSINKKRAKGEKLTRDEQNAEAVLKNFATDDAMQGLYGDDYGAWGRAGKTLAIGLDFMYDIGISGDLGGMVTKGVSKGFVKGATKGLTKLAGKKAEKFLAKKAMQYTLKATGIGVGAHLGGLAIANTTALGKTVGQLGSATGGHVVTDDKGSYHVVDKQKLLPALAEVERSQAREYGSEMIGEFLPGGKLLKKGLTKGLEKIGLSKVSSTFTNIGTKQWYKQYSNLLKAGGYNGIPGEVMEEYEGSLFDALTGHADDAWRDMTSLRNHVDIWLGCGTMGAIMGAVPMMGAVNHTANYYGYKHKTDKADKVASSLLGDEKWGAIREKIDQTENGKMADVLVGILTDKELNDQAKNATLDYVRNLTKMRGYNIANVNCAAEESMKATPTDQHEGEAVQRKGTQSGAKIIADRMNASYGMGYNATDAPSIYDANVTLKAQENRLSKLLGVDDVRKAMGDDPMAFVEKRKQAGASVEEVQAMEDYLVADSAVKGIRQRMADNLDSRLSESDAEMEKRINTEDGMVHKAVMQVRNQDGMEHEVYVLKGNVKMNADGRGVDASSSDNEIYVYDPQEGKTRMMPPSFIERIDEPVDAETVRRATGESIRQDYQSELGKFDTSGLSFQVGDRYDAVDERGVQHRIEVVGGAVDDAGNAMNGYVGVRVDDGKAVSMRTDEIAKMVGNADVQRREAELSGEVSEDDYASDTDHTVDIEAAGDVPTYAQNEVLTLLDEHGNPVRAEIMAAANEDGLYEVLTDEPIDGKRVSMMSAEEIAAKSPFQEEPSGRMDNDTEYSLQGQEDDTTHEAAESNDVKSALSRIPMDEETQEPRYEEVDADTAWDAIVEQTNGDRALAQEVVDDTVNEMSSGIEKAEKAISKATFKGNGIQERIAFAKDKQERMAALELEKERLAKWKRIASVERMRAAAVEAEKSKAAAVERKARQEEEEKTRQAREEAERKEREALNGVPNMTEDKPSDARARGYRRVDGHKVDRQAPVQAVMGKEVQVKFDDKNIPAGHVAVVDASELQPSHIGGQRNARHFIDEAQPKERKDDASVEAARKIASNIRPEEITTSVTAYTGAPTVNSRGEVIQGNNRSAALKEMWASHPEQGAQYKQYLREHAAEYGLTAEDIDKVQSPVLVNMLDVSDADAIALGQFVASDTESGGTERLKPKNVTKKLGDRMKTFSNILLRSSDEESSFSELLDRNGMETLKWLNGIGAITPTQYRSSFDSKGNLTAEAKNDLKGVLYQYVFEGGSTQLEEMFNGLPAKAQRAILSTAYRDYESVQDERMIEEIQDSIMAYHALSQDAQFMSATNHKDARTAVESWKRQYAIDDVTGESYLPSEKFSNFALLLAVMYKGDTQSYIQTKFNAMYDLIQGVREDTLFGTPDNTPRTLAEAIKEELNIDYDGQQRSDLLAGGSQVSQARETGSPAGAKRGERVEAGEQPTDSGAGTEGDTGKQVAHKDNTLFQYFTGSLADMIARAKLSATDFAKKVLAPVSSRLKEDLQAHGVKLDGDFNHVIDNAAIRHTLKQHSGKNEEKRGQIPITDADFGRIPDVVENYDEITVVDGKRGDVNIIYSKTYEDGTTVFVEEKREKRKELAAVTMWKKQSPTLTDANREDTTPISDLSETSSGGKDTNNLDTKQENEEKVVSQADEPLSEKIKSASEDVDTVPTEAQKEAGNYKKGHVQVGKFDITIEQPRGSIRKGTDANGKAWESKMHNTYGYIRGTVGVDGDHIDVFLSNDIDGWDGHKVYVVDQYNPDGSFDEHKVMLGFNDMGKAKRDYLANYETGWEKGRRIDVSAMDLEDFEKWIASSKRKTKPFGEYSSVKKEDGENQLKNKLKSDRLLYKATALDAPANTSAEQPIVGDSLSSEKQAEKNGGELVMLSSKDKVESLSTPQNDLSSDGKDTGKDSSEQANVVKSFKITPQEYTTKRGKKLAMQLVTFERALSKEQMNAAKQLAKEAKGWWSEKDGGFLMRDMESAQKLADVVLDDADAVADAQPLSLQDLSAVNDQTTVQAIDNAIHVRPKEQTAPQYDYNREDEVRDQVLTGLRKALGNGSGIPNIKAIANHICDLRKRVKTLENGLATAGEATTAKGFEALATLTGRLKAYEKFLSDIRRKMQETERDDALAAHHVKLGDKVMYQGEEATIFDADAEQVTLDTGMAPVVYVATEWENVELPKKQDAMRQVDAAGVFGDRESKLSGHAEEVKIGSEQDKQAEQPKQGEKKAKGKWVDDTDAARFEELRQRLHKKLNGQLNMGIDPEAFSIGVEMSYLMLKHGARKFGDFARRMIEALGENVRPYLKSFYNGARDLPEMADYEKEMTPYDEVRSFDVMNFDKEGAKDIFATAEHVAREQAVEREAKEATKKLKEERNEQRKETEQQVTADTETVAGEATTKGDGFVSKMLMQYNNIKSKHPDRKLLFRVGDFYETYQGDAEIMAKELGVTLTASKNGVKTAKFPYHELNVYLPKLIRAGYRVAICEQPEPPKVTEEPRPKKINMEGVTEELPRKSEEKTKKNYPKETKSNRKSLSSQEKNIPDLFSGLFGDDELKPTSNEQEVHVQARPGTPEREGGHQREQNESLGASQQHEDERADAERVVGRSGKNTMSDASGGSRLSELSDGKLDVKPSENEPAPLADSELKNTHNNHAARGIDYAPKSTNARIDANIKAIETMQRLIESGNPATPEDMSVLRKFSGWGGLGEAFSEMIGGPYGSINPSNKRLRELLSPEAYEAANMSRNSAYYTPAPVIDAMWDVARAMGFRGGNVLEGSAGIGNIIGLMPTDMSERSDIHAVEIDETTGNILSLLYPEANVEVKGFEKTFVPNGSIDLAITNVPFVTGLRVMDETGDKDLSRKFHDIHDFCIAKNVRKLKEGGIGIFISSSGTLDSPNSAKLRTWLVNDGGADVVGAFRMHNQTFGGTGATSDIIVIRKRVNGKKSINAIDVSGTLPIRTVKYNTGETKRGSNEVIVKDLALDVNKHFVEHPEDMAGEMAFAFEKGDTYRATSKGLYPSKSINQEQRLAEWAQQFKDMDWDKAEEPRTQQVVYEDLGADVKEGSMLLDSDGNLCLAQRGKAVPLDVNSNKVKGRTKAACFNDYKAIKDALAAVLEYQTTHSDDVGLKQKLDTLNKVYDAFVKTYGHLNKNTSISFLRNDMDYPSIAALESVSETGDKNGKRIVSYGKTDIFSRRVVETESEPKPTTIKDGIIASLYLNGRVDVPYIAKQLGKNDSEVREQIIKSGLGFENPTTTEMEVSYEYLSGNVREKLRQAQENNTDERYDANIKALERVIPMNIPAHLIEFTLGSSWVDPKLYEDFVKERTGLEVKLTNAGGTWIMSEPYWTNTEQNKAMGVISEKCDKTILGHELIKAAITCKSISVTKSVATGYGSNRTTETIVDKEATVACANKIDEIRQDFKDWAHGKMQGDAELSERMERVYNELFNNSVPKEIPDEFVPAHFGGAATIVEGHPFQLRPHQAKAVVRATTQPLMLAHEVGTGKTYTLISTAMEMRRLGTARKPMIVVQNATVGQFVASAKALYPNAKILTLEDADRNADGRRNFYAKIRYNDWDMIVVPQSVFERIPDSEERQMRFIEDKVEEKMMVLEKMREAADNDRDPVLRQAERELDQLNDELNNLKLALQERKSGGKSKKDEKREAKSKQNAAVKAQEMLDRETDDVANFDDMGVDALLIDEAHEYKHLGFATAMQRGVKGVDPSYSKKSQGVYLKTQAVLENKNGKNVVFATGTPISNTAAEIWTFMRYLMPADTMREYGIYYFDDFVRNFGNIQQMLEFSTSGKYKENNRFAGYVNLPELVRIWSGIADTVLTREAGGVSDKIPEMEGGQAKDIYLPQTKALRGVMKYVKEQLNAYENMSGKEKKENSHIPLVMYGIAKAAAVDARLVLEDAVDEPNSKTNEAVRQTLRSLEDTKDYNGTVAIFADNYQNKSTGFNLYEDIRKKLIESGVPKDEIVVMKSGMKVKKKLEIFDKVNRGEVRVIMGSTFTLGTGVNIQERLHTLIHVDAPNRPMDYTQRNGRILRQGNLHNEWGLPVRVLRFGVEDSLDVTAYQRLKTKGAIADSIMEGKKMMNNSMENRVLEEDQDLFGDITAQLSGSQYALLKNQVEKEVRKLEARKKQWEADQTYVHNQKPRLEGLIKDGKERAERNREALAKVEGAKQEGIVIGKQKFATLDAMADYIKDYNSKQREQQEQVRKASGYNAEAKSSLTVNIRGFDFHVNRVIAKEQKQEKGQLSLSFFSKTQMTYSCPELGLEDVPVDGQRLKSALEDIVNNVMSGNDFRERIEYAERAVERYKGELQQVEAREGKPFEYADELSQAKEKLSEYEELMKAEMAEKEAKYAEMDSEVDAAKNVQLTEEEDTENDLYRGGDDYERDEDISLSHDPMSKLLGESAYTDAQRKAFVERERKRMAGHVSELSKKLNLKNVDVVTDASTLSGDRRRAKGFFNKKTGKITIVIPNHMDMADVEKTLLHEAVAHHGLRKLFGDNFDNFLDNVYRNAEYDIRERISEMSSNHGWDVRTATEEYLAGLAEDTNFENMPDTFWSKIKQFFLQMLHSIGFKNLTDVSMGDNELRYVLWRSYENLKEPGRYRNFFAEAADVAKQYQLKVGPYEMDANKNMDDFQGAAESGSKTKKKGISQRVMEIESSLLPTSVTYSGESLPSSTKIPTFFENSKIEEDYSGSDGANKADGADKADTEVVRRKTGFGDTKFSDGKREQQTANERFNNELTRYQNGEMNKNEMLHLGRPQGVMRTFLPNLPIVMRQRILTKGSVRKHNVAIEALADMPNHLSHPIFVFKRSDNALGVLTEMQDRDGKNVCVAIELNRQIQDGGEILEVNDIRSVHGRNVADIVYPIIRNGTLKWADKEKGLAYLSSASQYVQQEIDKQNLNTATKVVKDFVNPKVSDENVADKADTGDVLYRSGVERTVERVPDIVVSQLYEDAVKDTRDRTLLGALVRTWSKDGRTRFKNKFAESYFDYSRSVKALQDAIAEATGRKVEWFEDVWKSLNAKSSIDEREQEVMTRTLAIPLSRHISSMVSQSGGKYDLDAIEAYLNAKHGLERNELMARRAAEEAAEEAYGAEMEQCRKALAADALDTTAKERLQELTSQYDAMVEESYAANRRDYAGLTALFDPEQEGKSLAELEDAARSYISEIEGYYDADTVDGLWDKVRALNNFSLKKSYESGLLSKKQYDDISKMYKWYVPLRGWHDNYAGDVYNYVNRGADRGMIENAVKKAYGRTSRAGNILGTMSAMANSAIVVGNKNKVAQVFMNLALNHEYTGLFTISEAWYEKNEADDSWHIVTPDNRIHEGMTAEEVADTITKWEDEMREKAANGKVLMRSGKFSKDFRHNLEAWKAQQHCVRVSRGGKEYLVYVNGNPRATQAINGLLNPDYQPGVAGRLMQKYMRHLARVQTSWSPKFVMSNLQRDMLTATGSAYAKHGAGYALQFEKNFAMSTKDIFGLFYKDLHGSLDMRNDKERMFKEFLDNGGKTGISTIGKKQEYEEKYNKSIRRAMHPASSAVMQGAEGIVQGVEFMNSCIENLTRFSTYMTSRQMGKSIKDAIFDAKECSVNFNMKGSGAWGNATLRKFFLYTNPALQALRMLNSWYEANNVRTVGMAASGIALGFTVAMVNAMCNGGDGDDNAYYGLSDYNRYTYFNIGIGNRKFLHWRLPQEMSPLYALGHISYDLMTERISTERAIQMSLEQLNNYSPLSLIEGNPNYDQSADNTYAKTFLKAIIPSWLSPFTDAFGWDEDFLGRPIGNRNEWNKRKPEWQRVDKRTPEWFIKPFEAIGKATGSNGYDRKGLTNSPVFNPSAWWFVLMQQGGGLAQVGEQAFNACAVVLGSKDADDMELKDYPFVSTVLVDAGTDNARMRIKNERFWMYRNEYEANKATISNITHSRDLSPVEKAEKISSMQDSRYALMDYFMKKYYKPLREGIAEAEANKDKAETKRLKGMLNEVKGMLLKRIDEASADPSEGGGEQAEGELVIIHN